MPGDMLFRRACGGGARLRLDPDGMTLIDEDVDGDAAQLAADPDTDLIREPVDDQFAA